MIANLFGPDLGFVVVVILVVLVGGSQLPKIARNVGAAGREFRKGQQESEEEAERERQAKAERDPATTPPPPVSLPTSAASAASAAPGSVAGGSDTAGEASITLSPSQLDALLKAREEQVRREGPGGSNEN